MDPMQVAIHEAGHAVVAAVHGLSLRDVTCIGNGKWAGLCRLRDAFDPCAENADSDEQDRLGRIHAQYSFAGMVAEQRAGYTSDPDLSFADRDSAYRVFSQACRGSDQANTDSELANTDALLQAHWPSVLEVARLLVGRGILSGDDVRAVVSRLTAP